MAKQTTENIDISDVTRVYDVKKERQESATAQSKIDERRNTMKRKSKKRYSSNLQAANIVGLHSYRVTECRRSQRVSRHFS